MKICITKEQAISVLPDGETIHTFLNPGFGLVGADWERDDILDKIEKSDVVELTGPGARGMGHGMEAGAGRSSARPVEAIRLLEGNLF